MSIRFRLLGIKHLAVKKAYIAVLIAGLAGVLYYLYDSSQEAKKTEVKIENIVRKNLQKDLNAFESFLEKSDDIFDLYVSRLPAAIADKPKWTVLWHTIKGDKNHADEILSVYFQEKVFFEDSDALNWSGIVGELASDILEHQKEMLLEVEATLLTENNIVDIQSIMDSLQLNLRYEYEQLSTKITKDICVSILASILVEELTRISVTAGVSAAFTAGGATAGTAVAPGAGTIIGLGVGMAAGFGIDWFLDEKNNTKIQNTMTEAILEAKLKTREKLDELRSVIVDMNNAYKRDIVTQSCKN